MIIVLGFDNTGKTILCNTLSAIYGKGVTKSTGPVTRDKQIQFIKDSLGKQNIFERYPLFEEVIYGNVLRGSSNFSMNSTMALELRMKEPIIIYCRPPKDKIMDWSERAQMDGVIDSAESLLNAWDELIFSLIRKEWTVIPYDYTAPAALDQLTEMLSSELMYKKLYKWGKI